MTPPHLMVFLLLVTVVIFLLVVLYRQRGQRGHIAEMNGQRVSQDERFEREKQDLMDHGSALQEGEAWYRLLFEGTQEIVLVYGVKPDGMPDHFLAVNNMACRKLEHTREQLLEMTPLDLEFAQSLPSMPLYSRTELATLSDGEVLERENVFARRHVQRIIEGKEQISESEYQTGTGGRLPVETHTHSFEFAGRKMIMVVARDITERKDHERALRLSEQRFRDFFANLPIGVVLFDANRQIINVNLACLRCFGVPDKEEFARFNMFENAYMPETTRENLKRGESARYEATINFGELRQQGLLTSSRRSVASIDIWVHNLGLDSDYKPRGYLAEVQDLTQHRELEAALRSHERQLHQAQKMQAIGTLSGGIAHDFNNILTPILGYSEMILDSVPEGSQVHEYVCEVLKASQRAKDLVRQILTFSRQSEHEKHVIKITPIVKEVLKLLQAATPAGIEMRSTLRASHDIVLADPTQMHQVFMNLCRNAMHAMAQSGGILEVKTDNFRMDGRLRREYPTLGLGQYLRISVRDTGVGMDAALIERIFEPFFTTRAKGEGTGMGLSVVHGIITELKGTITVESRPGEGSTFHVVLPTVEKIETADIEPAGPAPSGVESVLLVDDEPEIVKMGVHMLKNLGYQPVVVSDSKEALRLFQVNPKVFDVVITDQGMPQLTGLELATKMRAIRPDIPIILCTGFSDAVSKEAMVEAGICELLRKPVGMRDLAEALRRAISGVSELPGRT